MRTALLIVLSLVACNNPPPKDVTPGEFESKGEVLLKINELPITSDMIDAVSRGTPASAIEKQKKLGTWVQRVEQVGIGEVLYRDALKEGLQNDPGIKTAIAMAAREVLAQELFQKRVMARITDETIKKYYDDRGVQFRRPQAHARHILVKDEAVANEIMDKLKGGAKFEDLAREYTLDQASKTNGGDLGWFQRDNLDPTIAKLAFESDLNKPIGPIETRFGYHVMEVLERRDSIPLEDVREEILLKLRQEQSEIVLGEIKSGVKMERLGELKKIYDETAGWGTGKGGPTPPPPVRGGGAPPPNHGAPPKGHGAPPSGHGAH